MKGRKPRNLLPIGDALREARKKASLTQEALAYAANVDRTYLSSLENDVKSPTLELLATICTALGIATSELIRRAEKSSRSGK